VKRKESFGAAYYFMDVRGVTKVHGPPGKIVHYKNLRIIK